MSDNSFQIQRINLRQPASNYIELLITYTVMFTEYVLKLGVSDVMNMYASFIT